MKVRRKDFRHRIMFVRLGRWWKRGKVGRRVVGLVVAVVPVMYVSSLLQELSGSALWLPREWHDSVLLISTMLGTFIFQHQLKADEFKKKAKGLAGAAKQELHSRGRFYKTLIYFGICLLAFTGFMQLRERCVYAWDARDWMKGELRDPDAVLGETTQPGTGAAAAAHGPEVSTPRTMRSVVRNLPNFVNIELAETVTYEDSSRLWHLWWWVWYGEPPKSEVIDKAEILLPAIIPKGREREYYEKVGAQWNEDGLEHFIETYPNEVIDWCRHAWSMNLGYTIAIFLVLHIIIIGSFSMAAALTYEKLDARLHLLGII